MQTIQIPSTCPGVMKSSTATFVKYGCVLISIFVSSVRTRAADGEFPIRLEITHKAAGDAEDRMSFLSLLLRDIFSNFFGHLLDF